MFPQRVNKLRMIIAGTGASAITKALSTSERFLVCREYVCQTVPVNSIYTAVIYCTFIFVKLFESVCWPHALQYDFTVYTQAAVSVHMAIIELRY